MSQSGIDPVHYELIVEAIKETTVQLFEKDLLREMQEIINPKLEAIAKAAAENVVQRLQMEYSPVEMRSILRHQIEVRNADVAR